jgi:type II secretory pathway pseudopilin PulG
MKKNNRKNQTGFSLLEMIIYVAILAMMFLLLVRTVLSFTGSYRQLQVLRALDRSALNSLERMTQNIRNASSINAGQSSFGATPGILAVIQTKGINSTTTRFYVQNKTLQLEVNGTAVGPLTVGQTEVTSLVFRQLVSTTTAVKIDLTLTASSGPIVRSKIFHTTVILKGS